jgi:hypothetical protein
MQNGRTTLDSTAAPDSTATLNDGAPLAGDPLAPLARPRGVFHGGGERPARRRRWRSWQAWRPAVIVGSILIGCFALGVVGGALSTHL